MQGAKKKGARAVYTKIVKKLWKSFGIEGIIEEDSSILCKLPTFGSIKT
jgi:hypothetical protein